MKPSDSLDCYNFAFTNKPACICNCGTSPLGSADQIHLWSTLVAAHRLRVIPPGFLIRVFFCTVRAHRKLFHTCAFPVIRQSIQNRKPWSTAGAVDKRMQIPPVLRIIQFLFTLITDRNIRHHFHISKSMFQSGFVVRNNDGSGNLTCCSTCRWNAAESCFFSQFWKFIWRKYRFHCL